MENGIKSLKECSFDWRKKIPIEVFKVEFGGNDGQYGIGYTQFYTEYFDILKHLTD